MNTGGMTGGGMNPGGIYAAAQAPACTLRPANLASPADETFMLDLYASTRVEELAITGWDAPTRAAFIRMQFEAQRRFYLDQYPSAEWHIIQLDGQDAGRLIVHRSTEEILLMDIALLPGQRGRGVGTGLIQGLMAEAARTGCPLRLHVEYFNRALGLYEHLGFQRVQATGVYYEMEWHG